MAAVVDVAEWRFRAARFCRVGWLSRAVVRARLDVSARSFWK